MTRHAYAQPVAGWAAWFEDARGECVGFEDTDGEFYGWDAATDQLMPPSHPPILPP